MQFAQYLHCLPVTLGIFAPVNYLAHCYLSGDSEDRMIGNFIGDAVKGRDFEDYAPGVREGILLHRKIDHYTDHHPAWERTKLRLRPTTRKYAGVVADIFFDHVLARTWEDYHDQPLRDYTREVYAILDRRRNDMPARSQRFLNYVLSYDAFFGYASLSGIESVLEGMAGRASFESGMDGAARHLEADYAAYAEDFHAFFPDLVQYVQTEINAQ